MSLHFALISSVQKTVQGPGEKTGASTESTGQAEQLCLQIAIATWILVVLTCSYFAYIL